VDYETVIEACGGDVTMLTLRERHDALQHWRGTYAAGLHAMTGSWQHQGYDWHLFSFEYVRALKHHRAVEAYLAQRSEDILVVPESERRQAVRIKGGNLPELRAILDDFLVWPTDLEWTMAFTHEESIGLGPYFTRREWIEEFPRPKRRPRRS
jgi:hypothetical protein